MEYLDPSLTVDDVDATILSVLSRNVRERPDHQLFLWLNKNGDEAESLTYRQLWDRSCAVANLLRSLTPKNKKNNRCRRSFEEGDRVMICYPFGLDFLAGLFGCMMAGAIACSVYPPNPNNLKADLETFNLKVRDAGAKLALTTREFRYLMSFNRTVKGHASEVSSTVSRIRR